jgi:hypothetical protein
MSLESTLRASEQVLEYRERARRPVTCGRCGQRHLMDLNGVMEQCADLKEQTSNGNN